MPLLQTLALTFSATPIPFGAGKFPPQSLKDIIKKIQENIKNGKTFLNGLKDKFTNPLKTSLQEADKAIKKFTENGFQGLKDALPDLFAKTGSVATARDTLLGYLGNAQNAASTTFLGMPMSQWATLGNTLYEATQSFSNHTNELSGVNTEDKVLTLQTLYGNVVISGASVNIASTNVASANLSKSVYPSMNIGSTVVVNSQERMVIGKTYTSAGAGTVSVDILTDNTKITTASVATLNLANIVLATGSTLKIAAGMYINVNSEIKQVNTINALGDFLTVTRPFRNSNAGATLYKETGFVVNTAYSTTSTDMTISIKTPNIANTLCLDNVITGNGTTFTSSLTANNKIYYGGKEYFVISVTDTRITVDEAIGSTSNEIVYKVTAETPVMRITDSNSPGDILAAFDGLDQLTTSMDSNLTDGMTTRYMTSDGTYSTIDCATPVHVTQSLTKPEYVNAVTRTLQGLLDDLNNDAIRALSDSELVAYLNQQTNEINAVKNKLMDSINQDLAAINAVKGMLAGLLKLFQASCSKKKKGDDPENPDNTSDDYLKLILKVDPLTQGCSATESDFIDTLDTADAEFKGYTYTTPNVAVPTIAASTPPDQFDDADYTYGLQQQQNAGGDGDVSIDNSPDSLLPAKTVDPCTQPC